MYRLLSTYYVSLSTALVYYYCLFKGDYQNGKFYLNKVISSSQYIQLFPGMGNNIIKACFLNGLLLGNDKDKLNLAYASFLSGVQCFQSMISFFDVKHYASVTEVESASRISMECLIGIKKIMESDFGRKISCPYLWNVAPNDYLQHRWPKNLKKVVDRYQN